MSALTRILLVAAAAVAVFDAVLHLAIGRPEALRLAGNAVVLLAAVGILILPALRRPIVPLAAGAANVAVNVAYLVQVGIGPLGLVLIAVSTLLLVIAALTILTGASRS